jgi:hypothetical protein
VSYYAGDYYAGGYYAGSIFSAIGRGLKVVGGAALGYITGGPKGAIAGAVSGTTSAVASGIQSETLAAGGNQTAWTPALQASHDAALARGGNAVASAAKPSTALVPTSGGGLMTAPGMQVAANLARGFHPNRSTYVVRGGGTSHYPAGIQLVPKGSTLVRNRTMNWGNGKALARAERRIGSFLRHASKYMRWAHPGKPGHAVPKFPKRRKK